MYDGSDGNPTGAGSHATAFVSTPRSSESIQQRLARLRQEGARRAFNAAKKQGLTLPAHAASLLQRPLYSEQNTSPGLIHSRLVRNAVHRNGNYAVGPPLPSSWIPTFDSQQASKRLHVTLPAYGSDDPLLAFRLNALSHSSPELMIAQQTRLFLTLVDQCLMQMLHVVSKQAADEQGVNDIFALLPAHLLERLMNIASIFAPLTDQTVMAMLSPIGQVENDNNLVPPRNDPESWEIDAEEDSAPLTVLNLAFSTVTLNTLRSVLFTQSQSTLPHGRHAQLNYPFLETLNLSGTPHLHLSATLIAAVSQLTGLKHLSISNHDAPDTNRWTATSFLVRLSSALPRLRTLDVSNNFWLGWSAITSVAWSHRWLMLDEIVLAGCTLPEADLKSAEESHVSTLEQAPRIRRHIERYIASNGNRRWVNVVV